MLGSRLSLVLLKPPQHCKMSKEPQEVPPRKTTPSNLHPQSHLSGA